MCDDIGHLIKIVGERLKYQADIRLKESGLTMSQFQTMFFIHTHGGAVTQKEIETHLQVSHPTVVGIISRMEKKGFLTVEVNPDDHRGRIVRTTEKSDRFRNESIRQKRQAEQELVRGFTPEEAVELRRLLHKLLDNVSGNNPDTIPAKTIRPNQTQKEEQL